MLSSQKKIKQANIVRLVNLETILGFTLKIKGIQIYLDGHTVSAMCLIWGTYWNKLSRNEVTWSYIFTGPNIGPN